MIDRPDDPPALSRALPLVHVCPTCDRPTVRPRRPLTPAQERAARLLAQGLTCRQIARALHCSPRTVRMHVNHIAEKLPRDELTPERRVMVWAFREFGGA